MHFGADILQPVAFGPKRSVGTVIDYAYYMYSPEAKLAQTPYHSLSITERSIHNARKELLEHLGRKFREKAVERTVLIDSGVDYSKKNIILNINAKISFILKFLTKKQGSFKKSWGPATRRRFDDTPLSETDAVSR
jgi:hypothetical protein